MSATSLKARPPQRVAGHSTVPELPPPPPPAQPTVAMITTTLSAAPGRQLNPNEANEPRALSPAGPAPPWTVPADTERHGKRSSRTFAGHRAVHARTRELTTLQALGTWPSAESTPRAASAKPRVYLLDH